MVFLRMFNKPRAERPPLWLNLTVSGRLTWDTQTPVAVAHAATHSVGTRVQRTKVHQLGTSGAGEAGGAAAAEAQRVGTLSVARPVVVTGAGGARVHLLLACGPLVPCRMGSRKGGKRQTAARE